MKFKGKVSPWFYAIIIGVAALLAPIIIVSAFVDPDIAAFTISLLVFIAVELLCIPIAIHNFVALQSETLLIVFGLIKKRIPYGDIAALSKTSDPSSSLAASFDRIEIKRRSKSNIMIAVVEQERFLNEIKKGHPSIAVL